MRSLNTWYTLSTPFIWHLQGKFMALRSWGSASGEWSRNTTYTQHRPLWDVGSSVIICPPLPLWQVVLLWGHRNTQEPHLTFLWSSSILWTRVSFFLSYWEDEAEFKCASLYCHLNSVDCSFSPQWPFPTVTVPFCIMSGKRPVVWSQYIHTNLPGIKMTTCWASQY